jgi:hypothetical protein
MLTSATTCSKVATCTLHMVDMNMPWKYTALDVREHDLACMLNGLRHESLNDIHERWISVWAHARSWYRYLSEGWCCSTISEVSTACPRLPLSTRDLQNPIPTWNTVESKEQTRESQSRWAVALGRPSDTKTVSSALFWSVCPKFFVFGKIAGSNPASCTFLFFLFSRKSLNQLPGRSVLVLCDEWA